MAGVVKKILIVDDSRVNIIKAEFILKNQGYPTLSAESGMAALKTLSMNKIDLILLDVDMPEMNGLETLEAIRSNPDTAKIPVIFVTSDSSTDTIVEAAKHNISGYVKKPFSEEELLTHVTNAFKKKRG